MISLLAAAEFVDDIVDEPLNQFADELARWEFDLLAEVDRLAIQAIANGPPRVLLDQVRGVDLEVQVVRRSFQILVKIAYRIVMVIRRPVLVA